MAAGWPAFPVFATQVDRFAMNFMRLCSKMGFLPISDHFNHLPRSPDSDLPEPALLCGGLWRLAFSLLLRTGQVLAVKKMRLSVNVITFKAQGKSIKAQGFRVADLIKNA